MQTQGERGSRDGTLWGNDGLLGSACSLPIYRHPPPPSRHWSITQSFTHIIAHNGCKIWRVSLSIVALWLNIYNQVQDQWNNHAHSSLTILIENVPITMVKRQCLLQDTIYWVTLVYGIHNIKQTVILIACHYRDITGYQLELNLTKELGVWGG